MVPSHDSIGTAIRRLYEKVAKHIYKTQKRTKLIQVKQWLVIYAVKQVTQSYVSRSATFQQQALSSMLD
jgi:hypothetical protein